MSFSLFPSDSLVRCIVTPTNNAAFETEFAGLA
jgi:hypothetical protein